MTRYNEDRAFTDYVHKNLAVPIIYSKMNWKPVVCSTTYTDQRDKKDGIDYQAIDSSGLKVTIQERFRDVYAKNYNDFTIRYTRKCSLRPEEQKSEWYKIDATYLIYGITNGKKFADARNTLTNFIKYIVVDLNQVKNLFRKGVIKIPNNFANSSLITVEEGRHVLYTAKKENLDYSSEFIAIDPNKLIEVIGSSINDVVLCQKGFY